MSSIHIGKNLHKFNSAPQFSGYTKLILQVSDDIEYTAGTDTGRSLTSVNPFGSQERAEEILSQIKGFAYQPYSASGAIVDAAAELGDAVTANGVYSGVYALTRHYGGIQFADLSAPSDEEIDHEYPYKSQQARIVTRQFREVRASLSITESKIAAEVEERQKQDGLLRATLNIQAKEIAAKVSSEGGNSSSDFWWKLLATGWSVGTGSKTVFSVKSTGAYVDGEIRASEGEIANFRIARDCLSYNNQTWDGTNSTGIYIGMHGIQCGKDLKLYNTGYIEAAHGRFGSIQIDDSGNAAGSFAGSLNGCGGSVSGITGSVSGLWGSLSSNINVGSKTISTYVGDIVAGKITADYINAKLANAESISCKALKNRNNIYSPTTIFYTNWRGEKKSMKVFAAAVS